MMLLQQQRAKLQGKNTCNLIIIVVVVHVVAVAVVAVLVVVVPSLVDALVVVVAAPQLFGFWGLHALFEKAAQQTLFLFAFLGRTATIELPCQALPPSPSLPPFLLFFVSLCPLPHLLPSPTTAGNCLTNAASFAPSL